MTHSILLSSENFLTSWTLSSCRKGPCCSVLVPIHDEICAEMLRVRLHC